MKGKLVLEDGSSFEGELLHDLEGYGEVVFNTGMTGYQEILTDPSYCGQIVTLTYPLIGNYGVAAVFNQSRQPFARGLIISELSARGHNWQAEGSLKEYLLKNKVACLTGVDTRAITRQIRAHGAMRGVITKAATDNNSLQGYFAAHGQPQQLVAEVTTKEIYHLPGAGPHIVVMDFGIKQNILNSMQAQGLSLTVVPAYTKAEEILALNADGIFLSNGPGDPKDIPEVVAEVKQLIGKKPIFGICLGHQLIALALGADTYKLKFGHRGSNHPVKDFMTGKVHITSQNHGYAVDEKSLPLSDTIVTHRSVNDGTLEGFRHKTLPLFSVQFHPEAAPGPDDNTYLFKQFLTLLERGAHCA